MVSSLSLLCPPHLFPSLPRYHPYSTPKLKSYWRGRYCGRLAVSSVNCLSKPTQDPKNSPGGAESPSSPSPSTSAYNWCAGLGGLGFVETSYLTYVKLSDSKAFCPVGGGTCGDVLNSDYAVIFGVPLPLIGMIAYGLVLVLSLELSGIKLLFGINEDDGRSILLSLTTSMAAASAYFLFVLNTKLAGASCSYCLASAILSFSLFFITLQDFGPKEVQKVLTLPLCTTAIVLAVLTSSYNTSQPLPSSSGEIDLPYYTIDITTESSPLALSLARHLHSIGAKMYGAFWCSHCLEQKEIFGREAAKVIDYVECFPDGYRKGVKIAKACTDAGIDGFPSWVINGKILSGEQELEELGYVSGFNIDGFSKAN